MQGAGVVVDDEGKLTTVEPNGPTLLTLLRVTPWDSRFLMSGPRSQRQRTVPSCTNIVGMLLERGALEPPATRRAIAVS